MNNIFEILAHLYAKDDSIQIHLNLTQFITLGTESNLEGFVWSHQSEQNGTIISKTICPAMLVFGK